MGELYFATKEDALFLSFVATHRPIFMCYERQEVFFLKQASALEFECLLDDGAIILVYRDGDFGGYLVISENDYHGSCSDMQRFINDLPLNKRFFIVNQACASKALISSGVFKILYTELFELVGGDALLVPSLKGGGFSTVSTTFHFSLGMDKVGSAKGDDLVHRDIMGINSGLRPIRVRLA